MTDRATDAGAGAAREPLRGTNRATPEGTRLAKLRILGKEVTIACRAEEEEALGRAAAYVDDSMRDLKSRNATSSLEKIAIVTAINTADALLRARAENDDDGALAERVGTMTDTVQQMLASVARERRGMAGPPAVPDVNLDSDEADGIDP